MRILSRIGLATAASVAMTTIGAGGIAAAHPMMNSDDGHDKQMSRSDERDMHRRCMNKWDWRWNDHCRKHKEHRNDCDRGHRDKDDNDWSDD